MKTSVIKSKITTIRIFKPLTGVESKLYAEFNSDGSQLRKIHITGNCVFKGIPVNSINFP